MTDDETAIPVHASWHALRIHVGPYVMEGELPTLPGYDPERALARPNGEFVLLRDPRLGRLDSSDTLVPIGRQALVNRYDVEHVEADIMLGFFFPGAVDAGRRRDRCRRASPGTRGRIRGPDAAPAPEPQPDPPPSACPRASRRPRRRSAAGRACGAHGGPG